MTTLHHLLRQSYRKKPDQVAVHLLYAGSPDQPITYRRLVEGAVGYAQALARQDVVPGEVVLLILRHGLDLISSFFGAMLHGAIPSILPFLTEKLSPERYRKNLSSLIAITKPTAILTYPAFERRVLAAVQPDDLDGVTVITSEEVDSCQDTSIDQLAGLRRASEDTALLQHSSGTTGLRKGVALSHEAIINQLRSYGRAIRLVPEDVVVSWLPLYHDMGLIAGFILPILSAVPLVLMSPFDWIRAPYRLMQAVSRYRGTLTWLPNFAYNFCTRKVRDQHLKDVNLSSWRAVINCSEPMSWKSHRMFLGRFRPYGLRPDALATSYAMAENVFAVTQGGIGEPVTVDDVEQDALQAEQVAQPATPGQPSVKVLSAGRPIDNVHLRILDEEHEDLPERHIGEIALQSDCMLTSYYHRPDETAKAFSGDWYLTGDLGYIADGEVYITGRKKDLIIVGGKNIYPQDLEQLAMEVPGVHPGRTVAFGIFNEEIGTEEVVIIAEVDKASSRGRDQVAKEVYRNVARGSAVVPRHVHLVEPQWLIKTSSGKIARSANRDKYLAEVGA